MKIESFYFSLFYSMSEEPALNHKVYQEVKNACEEFKLVEEGDRILIGLSGGKDSLLLTHLLGRLMKEKNNSFKVIAAHVKFENLPYGIDVDYLEKFCVDRGVEFHLITDSVRDAYLENDHKDTCIHCSRFRRSKLMEFCRVTKCNKLTLGHHLDDIVATLLMNMTHHGRFAGMAVKLDISVGKEEYPITMIRPLAYTSENEIIEYTKLNGFIPAKCRCPWGDVGVRKKTRFVVDKIVEELGEEARLNIFKSQFNVTRKTRPEPDPEEGGKKQQQRVQQEKAKSEKAKKGEAVKVEGCDCCSANKSGDIEDIM